MRAWRSWRSAWSRRGSSAVADLSGLLKNGVVVSPPGDVGGVAPVRSTPVPKVSLSQAATQVAVAAWECEIPFSRARLDFLKVSCDVPVTIEFRLLACTTCNTDTAIEVQKGTLTIAAETPGTDFAGVVGGGVPGLYWALTARVVGGPVKFIPVVYFDRLGDGAKFYGDKVTP